LALHSLFQKRERELTKDTANLRKDTKIRNPHTSGLRYCDISAPRRRKARFADFAAPKSALRAFRGAAKARFAFALAPREASNIY